MTKITRRTALIAAATAPAALAAPTLIKADGHAQMPDMAQPKAKGFQVGNFQVTTLLAGSAMREGPQGIFGMNVSEEEFANVAEENFLSTEDIRFYFTPTLVNTGKEVILFDTGLNAAGTTAALSEAGYSADDITHVVITHMHGDHIGGLSSDAGETYANAAYVTGAAEFDHWAKAENKNFEAKVRPLAEKFAMINDGDAVTSGVTAMAAAGHTPGHMTYMIESEGEQMVLIADLANHYVWSLGYPDWEVRFDMDKAAAAASRRKVLGMLAADKIPMIGYHMPFPAAGFVAPKDDGFQYVPVSYQM